MCVVTMRARRAAFRPERVRAGKMDARRERGMHGQCDVSVPAVVFAADDYCALGHVRTLGRLGVRVLCADREDKALAAASRYCADLHEWDFETSADGDSVAFLVRLAERIGGRPVLFATGDQRTLLVDRHREVLAPHFRIPAPRHGSVDRLYSQRTLFELCRACGVPAPETRFPSGRDDVAAQAAALRFPLVLKAIDPDRLMRRTGRRMAVAKDLAELLRWFAALDEPGVSNLALQEFVPGTASDRWVLSAYYDGFSNCRFALTGRKLRQWPVAGGMTTYGQCAPCESIIASMTTLARAAGYHGMLDADFCHDARDGQWKLLDVNPRAGANFRLAVDRNGLDVVRAAYLDMTGQPIPSVEPDWNRSWMVEDKDLFACRELAIEVPDAGAAEWWRTLQRVSERGYLAADDARPGLALMLRLGDRALRSIRRRVAGARPAGGSPIPGPGHGLPG